MRTIFATLLSASAALAAPAAAAVLTPTDITVTTPGSTNDPTSPYSDDVFLDTLSFAGPGGTVVLDAASGDYSAARTFEVLGGRSKINAEWGDDDDGADGDDNPFVKAGFDPAQQETTVAAIQDTALLNVFNSLSLSEISDGEGGSARLTFQMTFENTLKMSDVGGDGVPDLVFFERGGNDTFSVELMIGGSAAAPIYSSALAMDSRNFAATGFSVDTTEAGSQSMTVGGFDFADWGLASDAVVGGFRLTTTQGPDLGGFFLTTDNPALFGTPYPVPLPAGGLLLLGGLIGLGAMRAARRRG